ncbi:ATP-binding protein [Streptomyces sp. NPDC057445]|uniref:ATP-binding protein n=1 Tax=Streptomyces sp. NPDC057445 TaxID=3346136 RepID=UPI003686C5D8
MEVDHCMQRKPWELPFLAEPREVAGLRRILRLHLGMWGLQECVEDAQLCVSELVSNVIAHVGPGTPTTLAVAVRGTRLRIEVRDPDARALPTLLAPEREAECGRGIALLDAVADSWGVVLHTDSKVTWCELATSLTSPEGHAGGTRVTRAEALLGLYSPAELPRARHGSRLSLATAEEAAIDAIADLLHWLHAHGCDPDGALDRAQMHFEAEVGTALGAPASPGVTAR